MIKDKNKSLSFSLLTFAYNEEKLLKKQIEIWIEGLKKYSNDFEIILINDGSTDKTGIIANDLSKRHSELKVFHHKRNMGIGYAVKTAIQQAMKNIVFWNDIDSHFNIYDIGKIIPMLLDKETDIVVAFKHDNLKTKSKISWFKSRVNYYLIKTLFFPLFFDHSPILDFQFVQFYPRDFLLQGITIKSYSSFIPAECLIKARLLKLSIRQIQLHYHSRELHGHAKSGVNYKTILKSIQNIFHFWFEWFCFGGKKRAKIHWDMSSKGILPWQK
ncbi:glycosyl transferase, family II [Desulfobacula toluolica Tol2]|uniref:Glycosyl transferase, family II n=2 Tax=Desulfobacula toluolica TaxID=28223 RepID=K0NLS0_DESTT|nr:glycosyl transferase, family II [Desulfobacula toluolica Tol2]